MKRSILVALALVLSVGSANAVVVLDFEGIGDLNPVGNFYNGGGTDYGMSFSPNALGLVDRDARGEW